MAPLLPLAVLQYATQHHAAVQRAGHGGNRLTLGSTLFRAILAGRSGIVLSRHEFANTWSLIQHPDGRIHPAIPEMLDELRALPTESPPGADYPFVLMVGERRSYNANQIFRDPAWRKVDKDGALRIHPDDARGLELSTGERAICQSARGAIQVVIEVDDTVRRGVVTLPHGYGNRYRDGAPIDPPVNRLTASDHCDPFSKTPFYKYEPVHTLKPAASAV